MYATHTQVTENLNVQFHKDHVQGLFSILFYASTLEEVVCGPESEVLSPDNDSLIPKIDLHGFADDHALKNSFKAGDLEVECTYISTLESTAGNVKMWMDQNHLKMNDEKTEFIVFASHQLLPKCETKTLCVNGVNVE